MPEAKIRKICAAGLSIVIRGPLRNSIFPSDLLDEGESERCAETRRSECERLDKLCSCRSGRGLRVRVGRIGGIGISSSLAKHPKIRNLPVRILIRRAIVPNLERASRELRPAPALIVRIRRPISTERDIKHKVQRAEIRVAAVRDGEIDRGRAPAGRVDGFAACAQVGWDLRLGPVPDADAVAC